MLFYKINIQYKNDFMKQVCIDLSFILLGFQLFYYIIDFIHNHKCSKQLMFKHIKFLFNVVVLVR